MKASLRQCAGAEDFPAISEFLFQLYEPDNRDHNWLQPIWEYAYTHPWFDEGSASRIGIWEDSSGIVAAALYELRLGEAFFQIRPDYRGLKPEMFDYAEQQLLGSNPEGQSYLKAYVSEGDEVLEQIAHQRGYRKQPESDRPMSQLRIPDPFPLPVLPAGFRLKSLADENDLVKMDRVLWRGFNHPGDPPPDGVSGRKKMQSGPHYRKDLAIVVEAENGEFAAFSGLWFDPVNRICYVEPVATDPDYRRLGLGTAAVMEGVRRCAALGAGVAYVGSGMPFYRAMGFEQVFTLNCWTKLFPDGRK
ncbi:MAG: GNAT family N-acetyltransferase [Anaerolineales bacterium]